MIRAQEEFNSATLELIKKVVVEVGYKHFSWYKLAHMVLEKEISAEERDMLKSTSTWRFLLNAAENAGKALRSYYPNREKSWNETFGAAAKSASIDREVLHIASIIWFELEFAKVNYWEEKPSKKESK